MKLQPPVSRASTRRGSEQERQKAGAAFQEKSRAGKGGMLALGRDGPSRRTASQELE
jgi:hypothetical protein